MHTRGFPSLFPLSALSYVVPYYKGFFGKKKLKYLEPEKHLQFSLNVFYTSYINSLLPPSLYTDFHQRQFRLDEWQKSVRAAAAAAPFTNQGGGRYKDGALFMSLSNDFRP